MDSVELGLVRRGAVEDKLRMTVEEAEEVCCSLAVLDCIAVADRTEVDCTEVVSSFAVDMVISVRCWGKEVVRPAAQRRDGLSSYSVTSVARARARLASVICMGG